jgi:mannose-6-phosphate isomerase-like protein (cupin superfamily)
MQKQRFVIHESEGEIVPDICGTAVEMVNSKFGATKLSFAKLIIRPGEKSRRHYHLKTEEIYYILSGRGKIHIDNEAYMVSSGHAIFLPIGSRHQIINEGQEDIIFVCADAPVFDPNDVIED